jgi:hypothetical protein
MKRSSISETYLIAPTASSVRLLDANTNRLGGTVYNDSDKILYLKLGTVASSTSYTIQIVPKGYFEIPYVYIGDLDGAWEAGVTGTGALVTEFM